MTANVASNVLALIPARMGSSRFPGKPMALLHGMPMIGHVYKRVAKNPLLSLTAVATCDRIIADYITSIGGKAIMTSDRHERASDRCAEALNIIEKEGGRTFDIVVMVQGDEPMTESEMITEAVSPMIADSSIKVVNLRAPILTEAEWTDRNCIKVVCDRLGDAIFFSRQPIPTNAFAQRDRVVWKQVCIIPFTRDFLLEYTRMEPTPLEIAESVDMMRLLEHGHRVRMIDTEHRTQSVDTPADLERVARLMTDQWGGDRA
jgi:3-deoxy-manno-octulosonate cytidylyltransferase (CMP-KDO synthetase)